MSWHSIRPSAMVLVAALLSPLWFSGSSRADGTAHHDSFYVSDEIASTVTQFDAETGAFIGVLIYESGSPAPPVGATTPNGIVVDNLRPPKLVVTNQNANPPYNGDVRVFDKATGAYEPPPLVSETDPNAPFAPYGILLYAGVCCAGELLVADEGGTGISAFDATTGEFLGSFDSTGYPNLISAWGMVVGPDGKLYVANRTTVDPAAGDVLRFDLRTRKFLDVFVSGAGCGCYLDHPTAVTFGPDGRLYVSSSYHAQHPSLEPGDTDKILVFDGKTGRYIDEIALDPPAGPRVAALGILFGPGGQLYATIAGLSSSDIATGMGSVRVYDVTTKRYRTIVRQGTKLML